MTSMVQAVEAIKEGNEEMDISQELSVTLARKEMEEFINQKNYDKVFELVGKMGRNEFLKQLYLVVKTPEQYNGIVDRLKEHKMVVPFYVHGDIEVVKEAIIKSNVYRKRDYVENGDLETALPLALKMSLHDRFVDLLKIRQGWWRSFEQFVFSFLNKLAPEKNGMALKRFLTVKVEGLRKENRDTIDTLCQELVHYLRESLHKPSAKRFLIDMVGQPFILTPVLFARGFLRNVFCIDYSDFIEHGWREAIKEGLNGGHGFLGFELLWQKIERDRSDGLHGSLSFDAVIEKFPTKRQKEERWVKDYLIEVERALDGILPIVLVSFATGYVRPTWYDDYILDLLERAELVINDILPPVLVPIVLEYIEYA